ncbi:MAG: elongation factor P hydroxylase [Pseudomonadota bacterium]
MKAGQICTVFDRCFAETEHTILRGGADEPLYRPPAGAAPGCLLFRGDYAASALHEAAHWCLAGVARRQQEDFGYPYLPPPRSACARSAFFRYERRPQALESLFADAAGVPFRVSVDDFVHADQEGYQLFLETQAFAARVHASRAQMYVWLDSPAGQRARCFARALARKRTWAQAHLPAEPVWMSPEEHG